ncbi:MAG: dihydroorotate dehydrogenase (quinone) [Micavibrio sp.]|mgnify:CR=1 FL=1|nr:dihydroorotate dehydrogenase (quinone) [Micavibrio sp.]|tara:strand:- start:1494 stop:2573 length:1080 start_codon:yes stop_codon:yes gene_type:complete
MLDLYKLARPALFRIDAETAHNMTLKAMKCGLVPCVDTINAPELEQKLWGLRFPNPVGLSAGFDKNAEVIGPAFQLGFGFIEAGTVTPKPQSGNPKPRVFRDPQNEAVINRMGFPNAGAEKFKENLEKFLSAKARPNGVVGLNIGMNKTQKHPAKDYCFLVRLLAPMADYLTINISSPNTPGLRDLQQRQPLMDLLGAVMDTRAKSCRTHTPPLLVKLAPDLNATQLQEICETLIDANVDGVILGNTTLDRPESLPAQFREQKGGLSGQPLTDKSTSIIRDFYTISNGQLPIIGVGGIASGRQAYDKIKAGASLVQLYTGMIYKGPKIAHNINQELLDLLKADNHQSISAAIGSAVREG